MVLDRPQNVNQKKLTDPKKWVKNGCQQTSVKKIDQPAFQLINLLSSSKKFTDPKKSVNMHVFRLPCCVCFDKDSFFQHIWQQQETGNLPSEMISQKLLLNRIPTFRKPPTLSATLDFLPSPWTFCLRPSTFDPRHLTLNPRHLTPDKNPDSN